MGVVIIQRPIKRGNVRTFDEEYNRGYTDIWASEVDAEFDQLYATWNQSFQGVGDAIMSPTPPQNPTVGDLWWRTTDGNLYIFYDDGNSKQFVPAVSTGQFIGTGLPNGPVPPGQGDLAGNYPAPVIGPLKVTTPKIADGAVTDVKIHDVAWAKVTGAPTTYPPSGPAGAGGGALTGTFPNPGVDYTKVTGIPAHLPPSGPASGALTGVYPNPGVDYNQVSNKPAIPTIPSSLPPTGPASGDLRGNYPGPTLRAGSTSRTKNWTEIGTPVDLNQNEQLIQDLSWIAGGGTWFAMAAIHGHFALPVAGTPGGVLSVVHFDNTPGAINGYPLSQQSFTGGVVGASTFAVVPFTIIHAMNGQGSSGTQYLHLTAYLSVGTTARVDTGWIMVYEAT